MFIFWLKFFVCVTLIFFSGKRLARYADVVAEKTGLSGLWVGIILVSIATSLPELFTGIGSMIFVNAPDLTVGNLLGANTYNLANIAILDCINKGAPLLSLVSSGQLLTAILSLIPLSFTAVGIFLSRQFPQITFVNISAYSILIFISYLVSTRIIFRYEKRHQIVNEMHKEEKLILKYETISLRIAYIRYALFAVVIAGAGIWLAYLGDDLAKYLDLGQSFVGSLFLGFATTLPEITVSITALRLGAKELAVANMVGSNMFNMAIIFINDVFYRKASIFSVLSQQHIFTAFIVIFMTIIICSALILKPKKKTKLGISAYAIGLLIIFLIGMYINFLLNR
ncbi:MAG: hypothetical protein Q8L26_08335 [Candidatus Omnitrophota bacterium]|nr:hypothetical protein [Candidatus Omnitrophota bacterium]